MKENDPRASLRSWGLSPKKSFGQNFLVSPDITRSIGAACVPDAFAGRATVVELGAGTGVLTRELSLRASRLFAVERDRDLVPRLRAIFSPAERAPVEGATAESGTAGPAEIGSARVDILEADAVTVNLEELLGERGESLRVLCGNLPYAITGKILRRAVEVKSYLDRAVFLVQEEVADRLVAAPGTAAYGALTVFVNACFSASQLFRVSRGNFFPPPKVMSAVVQLVPLEVPRAIESESFRAVVKSAFEMRRKTLRNAWRSLAPRARLERAAEEAGISLDARGETLPVEAFAAMDRALSG